MTLLRNALQLYETTWRESGEPYHHGGHYVLYHTKETEQALRDDLLALMDRFQSTAVDPTTPGACALSLTMLLHRLNPVPVVNGPEPIKDENHETT